MAELKLWLDSYDDIYSDFDSRHYPKRRISEDFLDEIRAEIKYKDDVSGELILLMPEKKRNEESEKTISESLAVYFNSRFNFLNHKCHRLMRKALILLMAGLLLMLLNSWMSYYHMISFAVAAVKILVEPAGWFLLWLAFDILFYDHPLLKKERSFFKKLGSMHVLFACS